MKNEPLCSIIAKFMMGRPNRAAYLQELYPVVGDECEKQGRNRPADETIRAAIYKPAKGYEFKTLAKGLHALVSADGETMSLLIEGSGRELDEIEDGSIDCIITDHPWSDKKAHTSGNQKSFADYEVFEYTKEDFLQKARVLKEGSFMVEFLPIESATNWHYLTKIKEMAESAGFEYYAQTIWRKAPEGAINTGRTTKGVEQMIIFSKGKPRRLAPKGKPYLTRNMLSYEIDIPANKGKDKNHQAEKPLALYEYLVENLTEPNEVCLDQFGGACNLLKACENKHRWGIVYELSHEFVEKAVNRFHLMKLCDAEGDAKDIVPANENVSSVPVETYEIITIPQNVTTHQVEYLEKVERLSPTLMNDDEKRNFADIKQNAFANALRINELFVLVNERGYANYKKPEFEVDLMAYTTLKDIYEDIQHTFENLFSEYERPENKNYIIENSAYAEYAVTKEKIESSEELLSQTMLDRYLNYLSRVGNYNIARTKKLIEMFISSHPNLATA